MTTTEVTSRATHRFGPIPRSVRSGSMRSTLASWGWRTLGVVVVIVAWETLAAQVGDIAILPAPGHVVLNVIENFGGSAALEYLGLSETSYLGNLQYTGSVVLTAWAVGSLLGLAVGITASRVQVVRDLAEPLLYVFGVVPVLVAAPFFLIWFGFGVPGQWVLVAFFTYVVVAGATLVAALNAPPRYEEYAAALGISSRQRLMRVVFPQAAPTCVAALRAALASAWGLQAIAELMGSEAGIGRAISVRAGTGDIASVLALILILGIVAVVADVVLTAISQKVFLKWQQ